MAKARMNENGDFVNVETGQVIGNRSGNRTTISSADANHTFSLDDYGVSEPEFPSEGMMRKKKSTSSSSRYSDSDFERRDTVLHPDGSETKAAEAEQPKVEQKPSAKVAPRPERERKSKYEVTDESCFTITFGLYEKEPGHFIPIKEDFVQTMPNAELHWVKFRMWTYGEELKWKSECLEYNHATKTQFLNTDRLNEKKIKYLMKDWSFGEYNSELKLLHCDGRLSDESYSLFYNMYPSIARTIVDLMNLVLESNQ